MKPVPRTIYRTADEIEENVRQLEFEAMELRPDTDEHRKIMQLAAQLRLYAAAKRWLARSTTQHA